MRIKLKESAVPSKARCVIGLGAFEIPAGLRAILVDRAAIVGIEKLAFPIQVWKHALYDDPISITDGCIDGPGSKPSPLSFTLKKHGILMAILFAARRDALLARAGADDRDADRPQRELRRMIRQLE